MVGECAFFESRTRTADVVRTVPSSVLILSAEDLQALMRAAPPDALALALAIARHPSISQQLTNAAIQRLEV